MTKFIAKSNLSISVSLPGGGNVRISFTPVTGNGSVFYTSDPVLVESMKKHAYYNHLFTQEEIREKPKQVTPKTEETAATTIEKEFASLDDAKDYLCDRYGYSRTKLRSGKAIMDAAAENNITLIIR